MPLPASWTTVPVTWTIIGHDGTPAKGVVRFTSAQVVTADGGTYVPATITARVTDGVMESVNLPTTDDPDISPTGWTWRVQPLTSPDGPEAFNILVPAAGGPINLATVVPVSSPTPLSAVAIGDQFIAGRVNDVTGPSQTRTALDAAFADKATQTTVETGRLSAAELATEFGPPTPVAFVNLYDSLFDSGANVFVTGQATTDTTLTSAVASDATVLPLASVAGISAGVCLITNAGAATQQVHRVVSVAANDATVADPVVTALASGATVSPLWQDNLHPSTAGYAAVAYLIANAQDADGAFVITGATPKVTLLGNSWFVNGGAVYATKITDRIPGATVVNAGVSGQTSTQILARFSTDVPADSDFVVFNEPGVNDTNLSTANATQADNLDALVAAARAIGAVPVYLSPVPIASKPRPSAKQAAERSGQVGDGTLLPAVDMGAIYARTANLEHLSVFGTYANVALGPSALAAVTTGASNSAVGDVCLWLVSTGNFNSGFGRLSGYSLTTGSDNTLIGYNSGAALTTASGVTALGRDAGSSATGGLSTFLGRSAGANDNPTTTASGQTVVGYRAGLGSATQANYITCLGSGATASGAGGFAIGTSNLGAGAASTATNEGVLGTVSHTVKVPGKFNVAQRTIASATAAGAAGEVCWDADFIYVCTATNTWKRVAISTW